MGQLKNICYIHFDTLDSTNNWAKSNAHTLDPEQITCITALEQTSGRGRWFRKWVSPRGENIYASIYFCLPRNCPFLSNLGQVLSLSCATMLKKKGFSPQIKWPNDILLSGKKVAGILTEVVTFEDRIGIVLGIGLNVNMSKELLEEIDQPATSLAQLSGQTWTVEQILEALLKQFLKDLEILHAHEFAPFVPAYEQLLAYKGQSITCHDGLHPIKGICHSITADGRLNLELPDGKIVPISAGEIKFT
jgi:BirA family transcriptional regulator, biotin operon repressor / biotin---[acetyl-CoA-carboxylase] ligase